MSSLKNKSILFVIDKIETIKAYKDSTVAMMRAAVSMDQAIYFTTIDDLYIEDDTAKATVYAINIQDDVKNWYSVTDTGTAALTEFGSVWMRKDPPVDKRFIHACYMLELAVRNGARVLNNPTSLVALNEKLFAGYFSALCPDTLVASDLAALTRFLAKHKKIIVKPLDAMGGAGVFMVQEGDVNFEVIWEIQTERGKYPVIAQEFLPSISEGDKRIIVINGKAFDHVLVRSPKDGSIRGNMAAGGSTTVREISKAEKDICDKVGPELVRRGVAFAGLDVIGDKLIEINITSPTGLVEISKACGTNVAALLMRETL